MNWVTSSRCQSSDCIQVAWVKSSYSGAHDCVQVGWIKSSYSMKSACVQVTQATAHCASNDCVQVIHDAGVVGIRDSKDPDGPALWFPQQAFTEFLTGIKAGEFTR